MIRQNEFRSVLLDLDGTLTDPKVGITTCIRYALTRLNIADQQELDWCIGPPLQQSFAVLLNSQDQPLLDQAVTLYRERFSTTGLYENVLYPEVSEGLKYLKQQGFKLYLATSKPHVYAQRILQHFDILKFFTAVYSSELSGERTDKTELIRYILAQEKLEVADCIMVGDRKHDMRGAKNNQMQSIAVTYGYGSMQELVEAQPDRMVDNFKELVELIESWS